MYIYSFFFVLVPLVNLLDKLLLNSCLITMENVTDVLKSHFKNKKEKDGIKHFCLVN